MTHRDNHTGDVMTDECVDESDGLEGRMNDCLSNCCRNVSSYLVWLILCIVLVTTAVCDALLDLVPHIRYGPWVSATTDATSLGS